MESPYQKGKQLTLAVRGCGGCERITAAITEVMPDSTMSVVMKVELQQQETRSERGRPIPRTAILKMHDRRFSPSLRRGYSPSYDEDAERAWREYVRQGRASALFSFMREKACREDEGELVETDSETDPSSDEEDKVPRTPAETVTKKGKREGIIQWKALDLWQCETRAYARLAHLQGHCIPRLLAVVYLTVPSTPPGLLSGEHNEYFTIGGILVEYVEGFNLGDLGVQVSVPRERWHGILQRAVNAARDINDSGVINCDCQPRNVMVDRQTLEPKHIDFAQCLFAEDVGWEQFGELKYSLGNPRAIGGVMVVKLKKTAHFEGPEIRYSQCDWGWFGSALVRLRFLAWTVTEGWRLGVGLGAGFGVLAWVMWRFVPVSAFRVS